MWNRIKKIRIYKSIVLSFMILFALDLDADETFAFGFGYQRLYFNQNNKETITVNEISLHLLLNNISKLPLQPVFYGGCNFNTGFSNIRLEHNEFFLLGGIRCLLPINFWLVFCPEFNAGVSYMQIPLGDNASLQQFDFLATIKGVIGIKPAPNFQINLSPLIRARMALPEPYGLPDFNGLYPGIEASLSYIPGKNSKHLPLNVRTVDIPPLYAGLINYYAENEIITLTLENRGQVAVKELDVSFFQKLYMDLPVVLEIPNGLAPGEIITIRLKGIFNNKIMYIEGVLRLSAEIRLNYLYNGNREDQKKAIPFTIYDKTAIVWDDNKKAGAYITSQDSILQYFITSACNQTDIFHIPSFYKKIQGALEIYYAMQTYGIRYRPDPDRPRLQLNHREITLDSLFLPRESLKKKAGDCEDLTVLFCALLEAKGIESGYIVLPNHIFPVFNTSIPEKDYRMIYPDPDFVIFYNNEVWVPLEITLVDTLDFHEAWGQGAALYNSSIEEGLCGQYNNHKECMENHFFTTYRTQKYYPPLNLEKTETTFVFPIEWQKEIKRLTKATWDKIKTGIFDSYLGGRETREKYNELGILYCRMDDFKNAQRMFEKAFTLSPDDPLIMISLADTCFRTGKQAIALDYLLGGYDLMEKRQVLDNWKRPVLSKIYEIYTAMGNQEEAQKYYKKMKSLSQTDKQNAEHTSTVRGALEETQPLFLIGASGK